MPEITNFDITRAAQAYSQIAGILAGFAFAVLVLMIERLSTSKAKQDEERFTQQAVGFLAITFIANVVTSVLWALVSGETKLDENRPTILSYFATLNFALVAPLTIESIILVIASTKIGWLIQLFRKVFLSVVGIAMFYLLITSFDVLVIQDRSTSQVAIQRHYQFLAAIIVAIIVVLTVSWLRNVYNAKKSPGPLNETSLAKFVVSFLIWLLITTVMFGVSALLPVDQELSSYFIFVLDFICLLLLGWAFAFLPNKIDETSTSPGEALPSEQDTPPRLTVSSPPQPRGKPVSKNKRK